ncbi:hypothetical protein NLG97_g9067 [Lecanicillium saksenae]|uniref:Uncharacterized protein n=1 Tax=Lecanicillium saksenae TaxID=468837 RepID=A0ACC1QJI7_9HYPO|nr:hypothetical protein NLG97_g9067 [Lecanicillium saksenae]
MPFGGINDCILLIKRCLQLIGNLSGAAVAGFRDYKERFDQLRDLIIAVNLAKSCPRHLRDRNFRYERRKIHQLLKSFREGLESLETRLGDGRRRASLSNVPAKASWPTHDRKFADVIEKLMQQLQIVQVKKLFLNGIDPDAFNGSVLQNDSFFLEDARGGSQRIDFAFVPTWEDLHIYMLQLFAEGDPLHSIIVARRYLFHRDDPDDDINNDIMAHDPGIQPLQSLVRARQRLRMTVIFPFNDDYQDVCPKCGIERSSEHSGAPSLQPQIALPGFTSWAARPYHQSYDESHGY